MPSSSVAGTAVNGQFSFRAALDGVLSFVLHLDKHLSEIIAQHGAVTYGILFGIVFAETGFVLTPFLPGDSLLFAAGAFAALGSLKLTYLLAVFFVSAVLGDAVNYAVGNYVGARAIQQGIIKKVYIDKTEAYYRKHGGKTVVLARFIPIVRTFAPFVAGVGSMPYRAFALYNVGGAAVWTLSFVLAGYFFGNFPFVQKNFTLVVLAIVAISVLPVVYETSLRSLLSTLNDAAGKLGADDVAAAWAALEREVLPVCESQDGAALVLSLVLAPEEGLPAFLTNSRKGQGRHAEGKKARSSVYKWLADCLLQKLPPQRAAQAALELAESSGVAVDGFRMEQGAAEQQAALHLLQAALALCPPDWTGDRERIRQLAKLLQGSLLKSKLSDGTRAAVLETLGAVLEVAPQAFMPDYSQDVNAFDSQWLLRWCTKELHKARQSDKPSASLIAGVTAGMASALTVCTESEEKAKAEEDVWKYFREVTAQNEKMARYSGLLAVLRLVTRQAPRFSERLVEEGGAVLQALAAMQLANSNKLVRRAAGAALLAAQRQIAAVLAHADPEAATPEEGANVRKHHEGLLNRLLGRYTTTLTAPKATKRDMAIAARAVGELAPAARLYMGDQAVKKLLEHLLPLVNSGDLDLTAGDFADDKVYYEVALLRALALVVTELAEVPDAALAACLAVAGRLAGAYSGLFPIQRAAAHAAVAALLHALAPRPALLAAAAPQLVTAVLEATLRAADAPGAGAEAEEAWQACLPLWLALLRGEALPPEEAAELTARRDAWAPAAYDALMRAVCNAVARLDLGYTIARADAADAAADPDDALGGQAVEAWSPGAGLVALNKADMHAFISLAGFFAKLLPQLGPQPFVRWADTIAAELVAAAHSRPLLSGFYRMLTAVMCTADQAGLLSRAASAAQPAQGQICRQVLGDFLQGVLVASRLYSDELLGACLTLLLSAPPSLVSVQALLVPLRAAFSLGLQHPPLAEAALAQLVRWETSAPAALAAIAPQVVPVLDPYLSPIATASAAVSPPEERKGVWKEADKDGAGAEADKIGGQKADETAASMDGEESVREEYKAITAAAAAAARREQEARVQGLATLQPKLQAWLGRMGSAADALVVASTPAGAVRWDLEDKVGLQVAFGQGAGKQPLVWLDLMLPQVADMAERSPDRQARVAAVECLHAVILWMVGTNAKRAPGKDQEDFQPRPTKFHALLGHLLPTALRLAAGAEPVARKLFGELVPALVHWLTRSARTEAAETMALLEAVMDGLTNEGSGALRDLCATQVVEFLKWSVKHESPQVPRGGAVINLNAQSVLRRLFERLVHPQPYQRLGAAKALAGCAAELEHPGMEAVAGETALDALRVSVLGLRMADRDAPGTGTQEALADALKGLVRMLHKRPHITAELRRPQGERRRKRAGLPDLAALLDWLWGQTAVPERRARVWVQWLHTRLARLDLAAAQAEAEPQGGPDADVVDAEEARRASGAWLASRSKPPVPSMAGFLTIDAMPGMDAAARAETQRWVQLLEAKALELLCKAVPHTLVAADSRGLQQLLLAALLAPQRLGVPPSDALTSRKLAAAARDFMQSAAESQPAIVPAMRRCIAAYLAAQPFLRRSVEAPEGADSRALLASNLPATAALLRGLILLADAKFHGEALLPGELLGSLPQRFLDMACRMPRNAPPQHRAAVEGALTLAIRMRLPPGTFLTRLLAPSPGVPELYEGFRSVAHAWLLFSEGAACSALCAALAEGRARATIAERALSGTLESLLRVRTATGRADIRTGSFVDALLQHLPLLAMPPPGHNPAADGATNRPGMPAVTAEARGVFLRLLAQLLALAPKRVLSPAGPAFKFILASYISTLGLRGVGNASMRTEALKLLGHFIGLHEDARLQVQAAVQDFIDAELPVCFRSSVARGSSQERDASSQLLALMDALTVAASEGHRVGGYLEAILPVLREMGEPDGHPLQQRLELRLALIAAAPWRCLADGQARPGAVGRPAALSFAAAPLSTTGATLAPSADSPAKPAAAAPDLAARAAAEAQADALVDLAWKFVFGRPYGSDHPVEIRRSMLQCVLLPALALANAPYQRRTLAARAPELLAVLIASPLAVPGLQGSEMAGLVARTAAWRIIQLMYDALDDSDLKQHILPLLGGNASVYKLANKDVQNVRALGPGPGLEEAARTARSAAFAAATALAVRTQGDVRFFAIPLKAPDGSAAGPWPQLLDVLQQLSLTAEVDARQGTFKRSAVSVAEIAERLRAERRASRATTSSQASLGASFGVSLGASMGASMGASLGDKLSASQFATGEDLQEPAAEETESGVLAIYHASLDAAKSADEPEEDERADKAPVASAVEDALATQDDELDRHPAMLPLVRFIEKAASLPAGVKAERMPEWMAHLHRAVQSPEVPRYARLFLIKALLHVDRRHLDRVSAEQALAERSGNPGVSGALPHSVFGQHAEQWFPAMVDAVLGREDFKEGEHIHYLLLDCCVTWMAWPALFPRPPEGDAAPRLMEYLVRAAHSEQSQVRMNNFGLVKLFLSRWALAVPLPVAACLSHLNAPNAIEDKYSRGKAAQRHVLGIRIFAAGLLYGRAEAVLAQPEVGAMVREVLRLLTSQSTLSDIQEAGVAAGILLRQLKAAGPTAEAGKGNTLAALTERVRDKLVDLSVGANSVSKFVRATERACAYHKELVDSLQTYLMSAVKNSRREVRAVALAVLQRQTTRLEGLAEDLCQNTRLLKELLGADEGVQANTHALLATLLPRLPKHHVGSVMDVVLLGFTGHSNPRCRSQYFVILRDAWQQHDELRPRLRPPLLALLGDPDPALRSQVLHFWNTALSGSLPERLRELLADSLDGAGQWAARLERQWASSTVALCLALARPEKSYSASLFTVPLAECEFSEYSIDTTSQNTLGVAPLFSQQWEASQALADEPEAPKQARAGMVRATLGGTAAPAGFSFSLALPEASLSAPAAAASASATQLPPGQASASIPGLAAHQKVFRRLTKWQGAGGADLGRVVRRREAAKRATAARESKVALLRQYRKGELPDIIGLSPASFFDPLGITTSRNSALAAQLLQALYTAALDVASADQQARLRAALAACFERGPSNPGYVAALQRLALADRGAAGIVTIPAAAAAAVASGGLQAGVLQVEEALLFGGGGARDAA
ncbi:hypothetical protein WJX81_003941, partial [Elliptochloris bilobata]